MTSSLRGVGKSIFDNRSDIGEQTNSARIISREIGLAGIARPRPASICTDENGVAAVPRACNQQNFLLTYLCVRGHTRKH